MKIKRKIYSGVITAFLLGVGFFSNAQALDLVGDQAKLVHTEQIVALGVTVSDGPTADTLFVEIFAPRNVEGGSQARFAWFDQNNVPVGSYVASMADPDFLGLQKIRIPKLDFVGNYKLQVDINSATDWLLATGSSTVTIDSGSERLELSAPVLVREPDGFRLSYDVRNYNLRQVVTPRLQGFFMKNGERQYVLQRKLDPIALSARGEALVEFVVEDEFPTGEYYLETWLESSSGRYLSGVLESYLQMPGSYARLASLKVAFDEKTPNQADILLEGFALVPQDQDLQVQIEGLHNGTLLDRAVVAVPVVDGYFVEKVQLRFREAVPFFSGQLDLFAGNGFDLGQNLLTQSFNSPVVEVGGKTPAPVVTQETADTSALEFAPEAAWWQNPIHQIVGGGLLLLIIVFFFWRSSRKKSSRVF